MSVTLSEMATLIEEVYAKAGELADLEERVKNF